MNKIMIIMTLLAESNLINLRQVANYLRKNKKQSTYFRSFIEKNHS